MLKKVLLGAGTLAAALAFATPAQAAFFISIADSSGNGVLLNDGDAAATTFGTASCAAGGDLSGSAQSISLGTCTIGNFSLTGDLLLTNLTGSAAGGVLAASVQLNYSDTARETLTVNAWADGFVLPTGNPMILSSSLGGSTGLVTGSPNVVFQSYANGDGSFATTGPQVCNGVASGILTSGCAGAANALGFFARTNPTYTLTNTIVLDTGIGGSSAAAMNITGVTAATVPEPGSMMLLGTGLFGIARFARRRFNLV